MPDLILASSVTIEVTGPAPVVWEQVEPSPVTVGVGSHLLIPGPPGPQGPAGPDGPTGSDGPSDHGALTGLNDDDHALYALADGTRGAFAAPLGADDNYVTDAEKTALHAHSNKAALDLVSGTNTGDQVLPTWSTISGKPAVVAEGATQADARTAIGLGTAATTAATDYATAAQGAKADSAVQPAELTDFATTAQVNDKVDKGSLVVNVNDYGADPTGVADSTDAFNAAAAASKSVLAPAGTYKILSTITLPTGCELRGAGARATTLQTTGDYVAIATVGGAAQGIRSLKIQNAVTGARTTYDIDVTNPTKPVIEDVEISNTPTSTGLGGILILKDAPGVGENAFMPQLSRVWIRGGRLRVDGVTDGHFTDGYVWAGNRTGGGAVEMANIADGWTFTSVDVVPPLGDGAGYDLANTNNVEMVGGYIDGSYAGVLTGHGLRALNSGRIFVSAYRFYNCGRSAIHLTNTHGCAFTGVGFFNNNKLDASYPDIDLYGSTGCNFEGNVHTCYAARTNGGLMYRADGASVYNSVDSNSLDISLGNTYDSPYANGVLSTFGSRNRPGVFWPRPLGTPNAIVPAVSVLPPPAAAATWPASNAAIFHRFTVERGGYYRYARFRCSAAAGNLQAAIVSLDAAGTTYTRVMSSGVIACTTGDLSVDMTQTYLNPGEYAIALWCDNTTATFWHSLSAAVPSTGMAAKVTSGLGGGIPTSGAIAWTGDRYVFGLTLALV